MKMAVQRYRTTTRHDYRQGLYYAHGKPRCYQPRRGGPPLLFGTDARATILVNLALASGPCRLHKFWRHLRNRNPTLLNQLVETGIVTQWSLGRCKYVALDPAHPAANEVKKLLLKIAEAYPGYTPPPSEADDHDAGDAPYRRGRLRDVRSTFGDRNRTMPLLRVYIRGRINASDIARAVPRFSRRTVQENLWMFQAFGILKKSDVKALGFAFELEPAHPLAAEIEAVLRALDEAMPIWRRIAESQKTNVRIQKHNIRDGRRKSKRWRW